LRFNIQAALNIAKGDLEKVVVYVSIGKDLGEPIELEKETVNVTGKH